MTGDSVRDWGVFKLYRGDNLTVLRGMPDNSVDSIVCDPPYGLTQGKKGGTGGFMGLKWDYAVPPIETWAECLRVLKPGGHLLAFAGTRTQHRMAVRIEDAGFEIRDMICWVYGSGFPKSLDVSAAIDKAAGAERPVVGVGPKLKSMAGAAFGSDRSLLKAAVTAVTAPATPEAAQWDGWGTALKPALEPITVARKPLIGTVAANVLAHGVGGLNIGASRVGDEVLPAAVAGQAKIGTFERGLMVTPERTGRWPANLIHDGSPDVLAAFPDAPGQQCDVSTTAPSPRTSNTYGAMQRTGEPSQGNPNMGLVGFKMRQGARRLDAGSAARFFYCPKASKADRQPGNTHPTVKPTDLMRYLIALVTPPGGVTLDPWMGSGSTGKAAVAAGFRFIGIDADPGYVIVAERRIAHAYIPGSMGDPSTWAAA